MLPSPVTRMRSVSSMGSSPRSFDVDVELDVERLPGAASARPASDRHQRLHLLEQPFVERLLEVLAAGEARQRPRWNAEPLKTPLMKSSGARSFSARTPSATWYPIMSGSSVDHRERHRLGLRGALDAAFPCWRRRPDTPRHSNSEVSRATSSLLSSTARMVGDICRPRYRLETSLESKGVMPRLVLALLVTASVSSRAQTLDGGLPDAGLPTRRWKKRRYDERGGR